jgi:hypothetical protein
VKSWPCGQDAQPEPGCHRRRFLAPRGVRFGLLVLTAGPVSYLRRYTTGPVASSLFDRPFGVFDPLPPCGPTGNGNGYMTMPFSKQDSAGRRRTERRHDRRLRRLSHAADARRLLEAQNAAGRNVRRLGASDQRYPYLTQPHD